jgi:uncharacterized protein (DUF952 family)
MILHILKRKSWEEAKADGVYSGDSLEKEGFIHCSTAETVVEVANYNFKDVHDLILLCIDESKVVAEVKWEDFSNIGINFPHIYGPLNIDSVIKTVAFEPNEDGFFKLPKKLV